MRQSEFEFIRQLVYQRSRICLDAGKREMVSTRLAKRLRATSLVSVTEYCQLPRSPGADEELAHLIDAISTNHTFFFREQAHFDFVRDRIVPEMPQRRPAEHWPRFLAWSAACSSATPRASPASATRCNRCNPPPTDTRRSPEPCPPRKESAC